MPLGIDNLETLNEFLEELQGDLDIPGYVKNLQQMVADAVKLPKNSPSMEL